MKKIDIAIWFLVGLALFLIISRFIGWSGFYPEDELWIKKAREMIKQGVDEMNVKAMLTVEGGYRNEKMKNDVYNAAKSPAA